jgi:DNA-binding LytR/AlgR family response regulator
MGAEILVCDANPQVQSAIQVILRDAGYKVRCTATGWAALDRVERSRPDAVILELLLPDTDGIELCRRMRERDDMPIHQGVGRPFTSWRGRRVHAWHRPVDLYGICTQRADFCTRPTHRRPHHGAMDIVAVLIAVIMFAALWALIYGIERI